jgi:peptidyl-prolyl cis-trans isomerase A (cyclophilin A)
MIRFATSLLIVLCTCLTANGQNTNPRVIIETTLGDITIELFPMEAPVTVENFLSYVQGRTYDSAAFYRTVTLDNQPDNDVLIEVIQGGAWKTLDIEKFIPITLETTQETGIKHLNGTISMARNGPDTATTEFFICINDQPELDFDGKRNSDGQGFAAFGQVISGMEAVIAIQNAPHLNQEINPMIYIKSIRLISVD